MEPSSDELKAMTTVEKVVAWIPMVGALLAAFLKAFDLDPADPTRILASIAEEDVARTRDAMTVEGAALSPSARGKVGEAWRISRLAVGAVKTVAQKAAEEHEQKEEARQKREILKLQAQASATASSSSSGASSGIGLSGVKLSEVVDQSLEGTVELMTQDELIAAHEVFETKLEGPCPKIERPTDQQVSAIRALFRASLNPYADLAVFGPYGNRLRRRIAMSGLAPAGAGAFRRVEIYGPLNIDLWTACFMVLRAVYIMLGIASVAALDRYVKHMWKLAKDHGERVWHLQYQTDVRFRSEELPNMLREITKEYNTVTAAGGTHPFDPKNPWRLVWDRATLPDYADKYWNEEFERKATLVRLELKRLGELVDGDAPIGESTTTGGEVTRMISNAAATNPSVPPPPAPVAPRRRAASSALTDADDNWPLKVNKKRKKLCPSFNNGRCEHGPKGSVICPVDSAMRHQCAICLGPHPATRCDGSGFPKSKIRKENEGGGERRRGARGGAQPWRR